MGMGEGEQETFIFIFIFNQVWLARKSNKIHHSPVIKGCFQHTNPPFPWGVQMCLVWCYKSSFVQRSDTAWWSESQRKWSTHGVVLSHNLLAVGHLSCHTVTSRFPSLQAFHLHTIQQYNFIAKCQHNCTGMFCGAKYTHPTFTPNI